MAIEMPQTGAALQRATGKTWAEWREVLDADGAADKTHTAIAAYLVNELGVDSWWAQGITVGYERMIGRRAMGQRNDGWYSASVSKTVNTGIEDLHAALVDDESRSAWLGEGVLAFRTAVAPKSARFDDHGAGVIVAFYLTARGVNATSLQVQADKLASQEAVDAWKAAWKPRLNDLAKRFS